MSDNTNTDPLSQAASGVNTDMPLLKDGVILRFECRKGEIAESKKNQTKMLVLKVVTTADTTDTEGRDVNPGFPVFHRIMLEASEKKSLSDVARELATVLKAFGKPEMSPRELIDRPDALEGLVADAKVTISPEKGGFPASNNLRWRIPA